MQDIASPPFLDPDSAAVFGAVEIRRFTAPDGRLMHAEVRLDDAVVMLGDCAEQWPAMESHVHV